MGFLPGHTVPNLMVVCRAWEAVLSDAFMWKNICIAHMPNDRWLVKKSVQLG